jgi:HK97 family phage portal protein
LAQVKSKSPWYLGDVITTEKKAAMTFGGTSGTGGNLGTAWLNGSIIFGMRGNEINYAHEAGDMIDSSAIMACVGWVMDTVAEAPLQVKKVSADGETKKPIAKHKMAMLVKRPNPYYSGKVLLRACALSFKLTGNAYILKVRNGAGAPLQLWYEPHYSIRACWGEGPRAEFVSHYEVWREDEWVSVPVEDVIHFRDGLDPRNPRYGLSKLGAALREVFTDRAAGDYTATMLKNLGVPPMLVSPKGDGIIADPEAVKRAIMEKTSGAHRGEPLVLDTAADVQMLAFDPKNMNMRELRKLTEERISALVGVPAIVAKLGAGLDRSTFANYGEAREAAYEEGIIPMLALWADDLDTQLLPDFTKAENEECAFDLSGVRVLQDDLYKVALRVSTLFGANVIRRSEARQPFNLPIGPEDEFYKDELAPAPSPDGFGGDDGGGGNGEANREEVDPEAGAEDAADEATRDAEKLARRNAKALGLPIDTKALSKRVEAIERRIARGMALTLSDLYGALAGHVEK